jgi:hypothetical protein
MCKRFLNGFVIRGYREEDIQHFKFCGITTSKQQWKEHIEGIKPCIGLRYFESIGAPGREVPTYIEKCICGTKIKTNAYILNAIDSNILVIGKDCCEHFVTKIATLKCMVLDCQNTTKDHKTGLCSKHNRKRTSTSSSKDNNNDETIEEEIEIPALIDKYMDENRVPEIEPDKVIAQMIGFCSKCSGPTTKAHWRYCKSCFQKEKWKICTSPSCTKAISSESLYSTCYQCFTKNKYDLENSCLVIKQRLLN